MNFAEYKTTGRTLYGAFADAVAAILRSAIAVHSSVKLQQIQARAKDPVSLRRKLERTGATLDTSVEECAKDLAGCRLILYSNSDVTRLNNKGILLDNFDVVWDKSKLHFPRSGGKGDSSPFIGDNYVVRLKPDRATLVEYSAFSGLLCEVQVQTILNHAWSETAHDMIYKRPVLRGIGQRQMVAIEARMKTIQEKYLLPAGYEFQKVLNDFEGLARGQTLLDSAILSAIRDAQNNNDRVEHLERYERHVIDLLDDPASVAGDVRAALIVCCKSAFYSQPQPIETSIGTLPGRTALDVVVKTLSILDRLRYIEPELAFDTLAQLYLDTSDEEIREKVRSAVGELAKYQLSVWYKIGPAIQEILLDTLAKTTPQRLSELRPLIIEVGAQCLTPEVTGLSSTSQSYTFKSCAVVVSDRLNSVRACAMQVLMELFRSSDMTSERRAIYHAMETATRPPYIGEYDDSLLIRVLEDSASLVAFLSEQVNGLSYDLAETIEEDLFILYRRNQDLPSKVVSNSDVLAARDALIATILSFRDRLNAIPDYVTFKTLVGFEAVFLYEWDPVDEPTDTQAKDRYRREQIAEFACQVDEGNADEWFGRLNRYAVIDANDYATSKYMGHFIEDVATAKPAVARSWLHQLPGEPLEKFKPAILYGLYASDRPTAVEYVNRATEKGDDLGRLMHFFRFAKPLDPAMFERAFQRSVELRDVNAIYNGMETALRRPNDLGMRRARGVLLSAIEQLDRAGHYDWTESVRISGERYELLAALSDQEILILFRYMENLPNLDRRAEDILALFADRFPELVLDLFEQRLVRERAEDRRAFSEKRYDAVPFHLGRLGTAMSSSVDLVVERAAEWYCRGGGFMKIHTPYFIEHLFRNCPSQLEEKLLSLVKTGDQVQQEFVVDVLTKYKGLSFVHAILRELVAILPLETPLLQNVDIALSATGAVCGEFGRRDALLDQRKVMEAWLEDERTAVVSFATNRVQSLDNRIAAEERRAKDDIAMRRLEYGEPLEGSVDDSSEDE